MKESAFRNMLIRMYPGVKFNVEDPNCSLVVVAQSVAAHRYTINKVSTIDDKRLRKQLRHLRDTGCFDFTEWDVTKV